MSRELKAGEKVAFLIENGSKCPYCLNGNFESLPAEHTGSDTLTVPNHCHNCGRFWDTYFDLCGVEAAPPDPNSEFRCEKATGHQHEFDPGSVAVAQFSPEHPNALTGTIRCAACGRTGQFSLSSALLNWEPPEPGAVATI